MNEYCEKCGYGYKPWKYDENRCPNCNNVPTCYIMEELGTVMSRIEYLKELLNEKFGIDR